MTASKALPEIGSIEDLLDLVSLEGIETYELRGRGVNRDGDDGFQEGFEIKAALNIEPEYIRTRFSLTFRAPGGEYFADLAVRYAIEKPSLVRQELAIEFAERIGIMAAFPFLREHVFNLASRLGHPIPVLGLVRQGEMHFAPDEAAAEAAATGK